LLLRLVVASWVKTFLTPRDCNMHDTALTEIKALLTLALLKSGTAAKDIQTAIDVAATTRLMVGEEGAEPGYDDGNGADGNVTNIRDLRPGNAAPAPRERKRSRPISGLNGDVKALLSLLLLQHGATSREILAALRMAAAPREQVEQTTAQDSEPAQLEQPTEAVATPVPQKLPVVLRPEMLSADIRPSTPKQRLRNDYLPPIEQPHRAA
jgi:hypothetical protein